MNISGFNPFGPKQRGVTLIEISIALFLSSILVGAAFSVLTSNAESLAAQRGLNQVNDTSRFSMESLAREIRKAGFRDDVQNTISGVYPADPNNGFIAGQFIRGNAQSLMLRYQGSGSPSADGRILDCLGNPLSRDQIALIRLEVSAGSLVCTRLSPGVVSSQTIGEHIDSMIFDYGIETNGDGFVDEYRTSVDSNSTAVSVKATIVSLDKNSLNQAGNRVSDQIRKKFSQIVSVRNSN